ncbi:MAG TPA: TetR/AcrR family transcriptional regulator [Byssovorax sp.]|jgi:AcrR family transcriptional regulator
MARDVNKAERRQELLRAARDVFATKGFHEAKVDDIVAAAKVAKGTFYLYFHDKRSVFSELVDGLFERIGGAILKVDTRGDVRAQIEHNARAVLAVLLDDPALTHILMSYAAGLDAAFMDKIESFYAGVKALLEAALVEGQELGIVAPGDAKLYAAFTLGAMKEVLFERAASRSDVHREELVRALVSFLERGYLRVTPPRPDPPATPPAPSKSRARGRLT